MSLNAKLILGAVTVTLATFYLAYVGASSSWQYYVHVDECVTNQEDLSGCRVRVNGKVAAESLEISADRRSASFILAGQTSRLRAECRGLLPDNLVEGREVVVEGVLQGGTLAGDKVLTRCASKYEPVREVAHQ